MTVTPERCRCYIVVAGRQSIQGGPSMKSRWLGAAVLFLILGAGLLVISCKDKSTNPGGGGAADLTIGIPGQNGSNSFFPNPDTVTVGQRVAWHNADSTPHTSTANGIGGW